MAIIWLAKRSFSPQTNRNPVKLENWNQATKDVTVKVEQTFGMIGAWSFRCFKPSQLKPSNHLNTDWKGLRGDQIT